MATKRPPAASREPEAPHPNPYAEGEMRSPFIPLLWLLIPFLGVILYGIITSPRFHH